MILCKTAIISNIAMAYTLIVNIILNNMEKYHIYSYIIYTLIYYIYTYSQMTNIQCPRYIYYQ